MRKYIHISVVVLLSHTSLYSQLMTFQKIIGIAGSEQQARSVQQTNDGGYIIAGQQGSPLPSACLIKTYSNGTVQWSRTYGGSNYSSATCVQQTTDGGYILGGGMDGYNYLLKVDSSGTPTFSTTFGNLNNSVGSIKQTTDGGYVAVGPSSNGGWASGDDIYLVKFDSNGGIVWSKSYVGSSNDEAGSVQQTADGGFIIVGNTGSFGAGANDIIIIKTDVNGNQTWCRTFGTASEELGYSISQTSDGGFVLVGGDINYQCYVLKLDGSGNLVWAKSYNNIAGNGLSIIQTIDGGYVVGGGTGSTGSDICLFKLDASGSVIWSKNLGLSGGLNFDFGYWTQQTADGGFVTVGVTDSTGGAGGDAIYLLKTDSLGNTGCFENSLNLTVSTATFSSGSAAPSTINGIVTNSAPTNVNNISLPVTTLCFSTTIGDGELQSYSSVYPNPLSSSGTVLLSQNCANSVLIIYDITGRQIDRIAGNGGNEIVISAENFQDGIYFYYVEQNNSYLTTGTFIVNKL